MAPTAVVDDAQLQARLEAAVSACADGDRQLPALLYALFAILDRQGKTEPAWQALDRALPLRRRQVGYDPEAAAALVEYLANQRIAAADGDAGPGPQPVFVVGLPGTGIRHLARHLAGHPAIADAGALDDMVMALRWACDRTGDRRLDLALAQAAASIDVAGLGRVYLARTQWRATGKAVFLDRNPDNYACIPWIMQALPGARVLHLVGGPMDTCLANLARWSEDGHGWSHDQVDTADHYRGYRTLMAQLRALYPDRIHDVRHDELANDRGAALREAIEFCGLPWHEGMEGVPAGQAEQAGAPVLQWRRYESHLAPLRQRLGALAY
ncbi:MAG: sulfotransferase [Pseudomonadota bacterium]|nr:sulfotransferase [Pseudomonadota bacterium]